MSWGHTETCWGELEGRDGERMAEGWSELKIYIAGLSSPSEQAVVPAGSYRQLKSSEES